MDAIKITAVKMKYKRRTAGCTWTDYKTNGQITKELKITPILDKLMEYKRNWTVAYRGGGWGVQLLPPPKKIPKALQNRAKLNPIVKTAKNC